MFIAIHRNHFQCSVGAQSVFPTKGISRSTGAKRFISALWFYKHFVPPGLKTARLFVMRTLETSRALHTPIDDKKHQRYLEPTLEIGKGIHQARNCRKHCDANLRVR